MSFSPPTLLTAAHHLADFESGSEPLDTYLKRFALTNTASGVARTYVTTPANSLEVAGYFSLAAGSVERARLSPRASKGVPNHPVPIILLARLAVGRRFQGQGLGKGLLRDAMSRACVAADVVGVRALLVHAKDEAAASFYQKFGLTPSLVDPLLMMALIKDIKAAIAAPS